MQGHCENYNGWGHTTKNQQVIMRTRWNTLHSSSTHTSQKQEFNPTRIQPPLLYPTLSRKQWNPNMRISGRKQWIKKRAIEGKRCLRPHLKGCCALQPQGDRNALGLLSQNLLSSRQDLWCRDGLSDLALTAEQRLRPYVASKANVYCWPSARNTTGTSIC